MTRGRGGHRWTTTAAVVGWCMREEVGGDESAELTGRHGQRTRAPTHILQRHAQTAVDRGIQRVESGVGVAVQVVYQAELQMVLQMLAHRRRVTHHRDAWQ